MLAVLDKDADEDKRLEGALLVVSAFNDLAMLRDIFIKLDGE